MKSVAHSTGLIDIQISKLKELESLLCMKQMLQRCDEDGVLIF